MKNHLSILFLLLLASESYASSKIALTQQEQNYISDKKTVKMCVDPDWEPFEKINDKGEHEGIAADLIQTVANRVGIKIELLKVANWDESLAASKAGKCEIMSFLNQTPKRDEWLLFTEPIFFDPNVFITREEHPFIADPATLSNETVALPKGTMVEERIKKDYPNIRVMLTENEDEAIALVEHKKAHMTMRSLIIAAYSIKKEGHFNLKIAGQIPEYTNKLRIGVIKSEPILRNILDKGIATITPQEREQISNKHVSIKVESAIDRKVLITIIAVILGLSVVVFLLWLWNHQLKKLVKRDANRLLDIEKKMFQVSKEAEIGALIANISHQWRDGLANINYINLRLMAMLASGQEIKKEVLETNSQEIEHSLNFMSETMRSFLEYYKPSNKIENFSVKESIERSIDIISSKIKDNGVKIAITEDADTRYEAIKNEWMQVWLNLINNSINAAAKNKISNPTIEIRINKEFVEFCDNCGGIDPQTLEKITLGDTSGLGIQMSKDIAAKYSKQLVMESVEGGVYFRVS